MIITKEQQEALIDNYIKKKHNQDQCVGFIDGVVATIDLISKIEQKREDDYNDLQDKIANAGF